MDARTPPLLLTPPRAAQAPPNTETPDGRPRRHARLNLGLPGGADLPEGGGGYQPARPRRHHPLPGTGGPSAPCGADLPGARAPGHRGAASFRRRVSAGVGRRARPLRVGRGSERRARHDGRPAAFRGLAVAAQCGRVAHVGRAAEILLAVRAVLRHQRQRRRMLPFLLRLPRRDPAEYLDRRGDRSHGKHAAHSVWPRTGALRRGSGSEAQRPTPYAPSPSPKAHMALAFGLAALGRSDSAACCVCSPSCPLHSDLLLLPFFLRCLV